MKTPKFRDALAHFGRHDVELIVVGGVAAVLNGAPISTFDLDLVHRRDAANLDRLLDALRAIDAHYRDLTERRLPPERELLAGSGHNLFTTTLGPIDLLGTIGSGHTFESLITETTPLPLGPSLHLLCLPALIRFKEELGRDKDRAMLAILRRVLAERDPGH